MDLQQFVKETLTQISRAIVEVGEELAPSNTVVNPAHVYPSDSNMPLVYGHINSGRVDVRAVHLVDFDVAVFAEESTETSGGLRVGIASFGLGSAGKSDEARRSESRVKFGIPIAFPQRKAEF